MALAMLCYPAGYDQSVFQLGGQMVLSGKVPWRDFLDTKPPLIFYLFALSNGLFGANDWSFRLIDVLLQFATALYLYKVAARYFSIGLAQMTGALYLMMYAALGFWHTAQVEGFASIITIACLDLALRREGKRHAALFGLCMMLLISLKFTLVLAPLGCFFWMFRTKQKGRLSFSSVAVMTSLLVFASIVIVLAMTGLLSDYMQATTWLAHYSRVVRATDTFFGGLWRFVWWAVRSPTPILFIAACVAVIRYYKHRLEHHEATFVSICIVVTLFSLLGVLVEGKMFEYQYSRAFVTLAPLAAIGVAVALRYLQSQSIAMDWKRGALLLAILFLAFLMSPLRSFFYADDPMDDRASAYA